MTNALNARTISTIAETLPSVAQHRSAIIAAMTPVMARHGPYDPSAGRHSLTAKTLTRMLLGQAVALVQPTGLSDLDDVGREHLRLDIVQPHYSAFGNALRSTLRDLLGADATPAMLDAWSDLYWTLAQRLIERNAFVEA